MLNWICSFLSLGSVLAIKKEPIKVPFSSSGKGGKIYWFLITFYTSADFGKNFSFWVKILQNCYNRLKYLLYQQLLKFSILAGIGFVFLMGAAMAAAIAGTGAMPPVAP